MSVLKQFLLQDPAASAGQPDAATACKARPNTKPPAWGLCNHGGALEATGNGVTTPDSLSTALLHFSMPKGQMVHEEQSSKNTLATVFYLPHLMSVQMGLSFYY